MAIVKELLQMVRSLLDRKSTRLNSSHTDIYTLSLHDALPIYLTSGHTKTCGRCPVNMFTKKDGYCEGITANGQIFIRSEEHTSELQSHRYLHSFPTRRSSDLFNFRSYKNLRTLPRQYVY